MKTPFKFLEIPNQTGRIAIITGANAGLGFEIAQALAGAGSKVIMACRSKERGEKARQQLCAAVPNADLSVESLDTSDHSSVHAFAERVLSQHPKLDLLINNAGVMAIPHTISIDGHEMQFATNHLGHFLLTGLLLPAMRAQPNSRIVATSSIAARSGQIDFNDLMGEQKYDPWIAYNQSKLANLMFAFELQRRLSANGAATIAVAAHPGASSTNLFATPGAGLVKRVLTPLTKPFMFQSAAAGAQPTLFAAISPDAQPGGYYGPSKMNEMKGMPGEAAVPGRAKNTDVARQLWEVSESLTGIRYP